MYRLYSRSLEGATWLYAKISPSSLNLIERGSRRSSCVRRWSKWVLFRARKQGISSPSLNARLVPFVRVKERERKNSSFFFFFFLSKWGWRWIMERESPTAPYFLVSTGAQLLVRSFFSLKKRRVCNSFVMLFFSPRLSETFELCTRLSGSILPGYLDGPLFFSRLVSLELEDKAITPQRFIALPSFCLLTFFSSVKKGGFMVGWESTRLMAPISHK